MKVISLFLFWGLFVHSCLAISCKDENGEDVDWWIMIKYPEIVDSDDSVVASGFGYAYLDAHSPYLNKTGLRLDQNTNGALGATIQQLRNRGSGLGYGLYNDEKPDSDCYDDLLFYSRDIEKRSPSYGHTKGVVGFDESGGFWLSHSTPRFPNLVAKSYSFPDCAKQYGQNFICISTSLETLDVIGRNFQDNHPQFYDTSMPSQFEERLPAMHSVFNKKNYTRGSSANVRPIQSLCGQEFITFSKNKEWDNELYEALVAPYFRTDLYTETWIRYPSLPSYCKPKWTWEVKEAQDICMNGVCWPYTKDHSKWAVTESSNQGYTCIGDINRMSSQASRGGGTTCIRNSAIYKTFYSSIQDFQDCE
eukprot:GCRY01000895.1.p1 GENE.GCRY01000895.1~~GCRY01000895.1.p1  ORF type:complete len:363 (-),score=66.53 GCRY01000895.1:260-1348(-)